MTNGKTMRTTLALPIDLVERVDIAVQEGSARSRNDFVAAAIRHELAAADEAAIDAAFELMAEDEAYQAEAQTIGEEFAIADWEAFRLAEPER